MPLNEAEDLKFMSMALEEARAAADHDDVPVGAVLVGADGSLLSVGRNEREKLKSPTAHAEVQALEKGAAQIKSWNLSGSTLYVTLEPCPMCAGALVQARVAELVFATPDPKGGALSLGISVLENPQLNHRVQVRQGPCAQEASSLLKTFFQKKRREKGTSGRKE